jgi:hypothetical protein
MRKEVETNERLMRTTSLTARTATTRDKRSDDIRYAYPQMLRDAISMKSENDGCGDLCGQEIEMLDARPGSRDLQVRDLYDCTLKSLLSSSY